jgi:hypothetical protein
MSSLKPPDYPILPSRLPAFACNPVHLSFLTFLVEFLRPGVFVELVTKDGSSYLACCQAIKERGLHTRCYGIWTGKDGQECEASGEETFADLKEYHDELYEEFSRLVRSRFDEASNDFEEGAIDLLYISGHSSEDALQQIFNVWLPKMCDQGVILLDSINVSDADGGASKLWEEISSFYPHFELMDENGLGMIALGRHEASELGRFMHIARIDAGLLNLFFRQLGQSLDIHLRKERLVTELITRTEEQDLRIQSLSAQLAASRQELVSLSEKWHANYKSLLVKWGAQQREAAEDRESAIQSLSSALLKDPEERLKLWAELRARDIQLKAKENDLEAIANELTVTRTRLENILASRAWRWVTRYGRIKAFLLAPLHRIFNKPVF